MAMKYEEFIIFLTSAILTYYYEEVDPNLKTRNVPQEELKKEYDFIIVGAGSAGCVLANRLTEVPYWTVLLMEAGGEETAISRVPFLSRTLPHTDLDWNYTTIPQKRVCRVYGGFCPFALGNVMGGSSGVNNMNYARGTRGDYDDWKRLGNDGWGYDDVLPYFIKAENVSSEPDLSSLPDHGTKGPLHIQYAKFRTVLATDYIKAAEELGLKKRDYNAENQKDSIDYVQMNIKGPSRLSTSKAYLQPIRNRKNLSVIKKSFVTKIIISKNNCKGVQYIRHGKTYRVKAKMEVIISAGALNTPKLLMLSGIGPREILAKYKIKVISDIAVGIGFHDHLSGRIYFELNKNVTIVPNIWRTKSAAIKYAKYRRGPLSTSGYEGKMYVGSLPDVMFQIRSHDEDKRANTSKQIINVIVYLTKPKSRGSVSLRSRNPFDSPRIDPNYLSEEIDYDKFYQGLKFVFKYMKTKTMRRYSPKLNFENTPKCKGLNEDKFIKCIIKQYARSGIHFSSTAKMGPARDPSAVVSPRLKVRGCTNLRVVDGSVIPIVPRANTNGPIVMIAEKVADMIKEEYDINIPPYP